MDLPVGLIARVTDPQGVTFYVSKPVPPADDPDTQSDVFSPMEAQHFRWNELSTTDPDAALDFYARHFGWTQEGQMQMGDLGSYRFIQKDGVGNGAVMPKMAEMPISCWSYDIGVDDTVTAEGAIEDDGGTVHTVPN